MSTSITRRSSAGIISIVLSFALFFAIPVQADESRHKADDTAMIMQVITDRTNGEIHIYGSNLVEDDHVTVLLGGYELVVFNAGKGWIDAYLPSGLADGDYQLSVLDEEGESIVLYDLTVSAEGVMGLALARFAPARNDMDNVLRQSGN